jgi:long-chain fatty acid transport protein
MGTRGKHLAYSIVAAHTAALLFSSPGGAAGISIREQSAEGQGASFAGVAAGTDGLSSMFWNPATMSQHVSEGYVSESNFSVISPSANADDGSGAPGSPDSGDIAKTGIVGASYSVYSLTDDITIGLATGTPFGLSTNADSWVGSPHGDESSALTFNVNPNISYRINDMLSVGVGVQGEYMRVKLTSDTPLGAEFFNADADDIGFGFTAGVLFQPAEGTSVGLGFRSSISHTLKGDATLLTTGFDGDVSADFDTPELVTLGLRHRLTDEITVMAGIEWANWSRFKSLEIKRDDTGAVLASTAEDWDDSWFYAVGAEYQFSDALKLRAGFAYEDSGVPDATRTPRVPDNDRYWLSAGASFQVTDWITASLAYSYVFVDDGKVNLPATPALPALSATFGQNIQIISAGATLDW